MRVRWYELDGWSFLMATVHGAGLMVAPLLLGVMAMEGPAMMASSTGINVGLAVSSHTLSMLVIMAVIAWIVYAKLGLMVLRQDWLNFDFSSSRATRMKVCWSSFEISSALANSPTSCLEGLRFPDSIFRKAPTEQPARCANSTWVRSNAFRRRLSHSQKMTGEFCSSIFGLKIVAHFGVATGSFAAPNEPRVSCLI